MLWTRSLRFRLTLWYTGALAVLLLTAAMLGHAAARHALLGEADAFLRAEAARIRASVAADPADATELPEALALPRNAPHENFDVVYALALDPRTGKIAAQSSALAAEPNVQKLLLDDAPASQIPRWKPPLRVLTQTLPFGKNLLTLRVAVSWERRADLLARFDRTLLLFCPLVLAFAAVGSWLLVGRTLRPIEKIVREAERLDPQAPPVMLLPAPRETDSELGRLVAALNAMTGRLHHAFAAQSRFASAQQRFAADASHELRTPLTILRGEIELALSRPRPPELYQKTLVSAVEEIERLSHIVEGLSFLARRDAGQISVAPRQHCVNLAALAETVRADFDRRATAKNVTLSVENGSVEDGSEAASVTGGAGQLRQILANLTDNALKYTPPGGSVTLSVQCEHGEILTRVADTGIGLSADEQSHVFERFWRADRARQAGGSGLGLALCQEIAAAHGGKITVQSTPGAGSVFTLRLPQSNRTASANLL